MRGPLSGTHTRKVHAKKTGFILRSPNGLQYESDRRDQSGSVWSVMMKVGFKPKDNLRCYYNNANVHSLTSS